MRRLLDRPELVRPELVRPELVRPELVRLGKPVRFVFVEEREDRLGHLESLVEAKFSSRPQHLAVDLVRGSCEVFWERALTDSHA